MNDQTTKEHEKAAETGGQVDPVVGGPFAPIAPGTLCILRDDLSERLDEMADLAEHWKRWRETRNHTPRHIRNALCLLAVEVVELEAIEKKHGQRMEPV